MTNWLVLFGGLVLFAAGCLPTVGSACSHAGEIHCLGSERAIVCTSTGWREFPCPSSCTTTPSCGKFGCGAPDEECHFLNSAVGTPCPDTLQIDFCTADGQPVQCIRGVWVQGGQPDWPPLYCR